MDQEKENDVEFEEYQKGEEIESDDQDDDSSSSNSDSDNDEDEEVDDKMDTLNEAEYKEKFESLEKAIAENPFGYENYVAIIKLLREHGEFKPLRDYRTKMSETFPLSETLWLEWLKDEQKFLDSKEDRDRIDLLFQKAVDDYLSVDIWLEYIQYSIGGMGEPNGIEKIRTICEQAILSAGFHVTKGYALWEAYRELENAILVGLQQSTAGSISAESTKKLNEQIDRIARLFKLQLGVCLDNLESTMDEFKQFDDTKLDERTKSVYEKRLAQYKKLAAFEEELTKSSQDAVKKLANYKKYIEFELKELKDLEKQVKGKSNATSEIEAEISNSRLRVKCLYERALADNSNCLDQQLWLDYIEFLVEEELNSSNEVLLKSNLNVMKRATRNCPWSARIWINYALSLERSRASREELKALFNQAMNSGFQTGKDYLQIWHAYLDYLRRFFVSETSADAANAANTNKEELIEEIRDSFQKAIDQLYEYFKNDGDPLYTLEKFWSLVEAKYFKSIDRARKIWNEQILKKGRSTKYAADWLEFFELESQYGDEKHQRKLLNRALNEVVESNEKEIILEILHKFEKLNGNASQFQQVNIKYERFKDELHKQRQAAQELLKQQKTTNPKKTDAKSQSDHKNSKQANDQSNLKRKTSNGTESGGDVVTPKKVDRDGFTVPQLPSPTEAPSNKKPKTETESSKQTPKANEPKKAAVPPPPSLSAEQSKKPVGANSNLTVFISNLDFQVDEAKIKAIFEKEPGFKEVRLIRHWSGKNKGYGYVDFETPDQAQSALKLDRTPIDGRPLFVSPNEDKSLDFGQKKFKYATNLEKNKLFVTGLPFTADKAEVEKIFGAFGNLKDVRIVTHKSGKSKGMAYVDFEDEKSAKNALLQTDGMLIGEFQIAVAISNPPKKKGGDQDAAQPSTSQQAQSSLGGGTVSNRAPSNPSSSAMSFLPRSQLMTSRKKTLNLK